MKCSECNKSMASAHENYNYVASGLPYVTLVGVEVRRCKACGEHEVIIPRITHLHRVIALAVIGKRARLTGAEIRFLRKYLDWSGTDFARHMGVKGPCVSRWENDREPMSATGDRLLRLMVATTGLANNYPLDLLAELEETSSPVRLRVESTKGAWHAKAVAA